VLVDALVNDDTVEPDLLAEVERAQVALP